MSLAHRLTTCQRTLKFINDEASSIHGNMRVGSIYTSESGEWKIGGFEVLSNVKDDDAIIYVCVFKKLYRIPSRLTVITIELWKYGTRFGEVRTSRATIRLGCYKKGPSLRRRLV